MQPAFWHERWSMGQIGFHRDSVHPDIAAHASWLLPAPGRVLVPLCGKTLDLVWLHERGHEVVGVELSSIAAEEVFAQWGRTPQVDTVGGLTRYRHQRLTVLCGDFFDVSPGLTQPFDGIWDRAAMVALPPAMRERYVPHLLGLARPEARVLLNVLHYNDCAKAGPPHSVSPDEVRRRYQGTALEHIEDRDLSDEIRPPWAEGGMTSLHSHLFRIELPA